MFGWVKRNLSPIEVIDVSLGLFAIAVTANVEYWNYEANSLFPRALESSYGRLRMSDEPLCYALLMGLTLYFLIPYLILRSISGLLRKRDKVYEFVVMASVLSLVSILRIGYFSALAKILD